MAKKCYKCENWAAEIADLNPEGIDMDYCPFCGHELKTISHELYENIVTINYDNDLKIRFIFNNDDSACQLDDILSECVDISINN